MTALVIGNRDARRLLVERAGLLARPAATRAGGTVDAAAAVVAALGMVQIDPIRTVARAHEHILWSRDGGCRPPTFERLLETRRVFEHFSHDAAILPMGYRPFWRRQFTRRATALERGAWGRALPSANERHAIVERIAREGPLSARDFEGRADRSVHAWMKKPHKLALDWLWLEGTLGVSHRAGFVKHYDLAERLVPATVLADVRDDEEQIERLLGDALERLGVATSGELQRFWEATTPEETRRWIEARGDALVEVRVTAADGRRLKAFAPHDIEARLAALPEPGERLRAINPFDPLVRDRARLARVFGFDYRIEMYVPAAKRRYGYYVYPLLEGTRFVGRAEIVADRKRGRLELVALWPEPGVAFGAGRRARLDAELRRLARLAGVREVVADRRG